MLLRGLSGAVCVCLTLLSAPGAGAEPIVVFAAASTKNALDQALAEFGQQTGQQAVASYAASSALARQILSGAPADVFVSADTRWMDHLIAKGQVRDGSVAVLARNRLALVAAQDFTPPADLLPVRAGMPLAKSLGANERLAMADPAHVPAGRYARAALEKLDIWPAVQARIVPAANVRLALALVARGETPLGIVYASDVTAGAPVKQLALLPGDTHPPIQYPGALTARSGHGQARALLAYLRSDQARKIFRAHGFGPQDSR